MSRRISLLAGDRSATDNVRIVSEDVFSIETRSGAIERITVDATRWLDGAGIAAATESAGWISAVVVSPTIQVSVTGSDSSQSATISIEASDGRMRLITLMTRGPASTATAIAGGGGGGGGSVFVETLEVFDSRLELSQSTTSTLTNAVIIHGFDQAGDFAPAQMVRSSSAPTHPLSVQDATGAWFQFVDRYVDIRWAGAKGDGATDNAAAINSVLAYLNSRGGGTCVIPAGEFNVNAQLVVYNNTTIHFMPRSALIRTWQSTNADKRVSATIRNEHAISIGAYIVDPGPYIPPNRNSGIRIIGHGEIRMSAAARAWADAGGFNSPGTNGARMPHIYLTACDNVYIGDGLTMDTGGREWTITQDGDNWTYNGLRIRDGVTIWADGIHMQRGTNTTINGCIIESGDDAIAIGSNFNLPISDVTITGCVLKTRFARALSVYTHRSGSTAGFGPVNQMVQDVTASGNIYLGGAVSNNPLSIFTDVAGMVRDVYVSGLFDSGPVADYSGSNPHFMVIDNAINVTVEARFRRPMRGARILGAADNIVLTIDADAPQVPGWVALEHNATGLVTLAGGAWRPADRAIVSVTSSGALDVDGTRFEGILSNFPAIDVRSATAQVRVRGSRARKASGASNTRFLNVDAAAAGCTLESDAIDIGSGSLGVDLFAALAGLPARYQNGRASGTPRTATIASSAINAFGLPIVGLLRGTIGNLVSVTGLAEGCEIDLYNAEASPGTNTVTLVHGTGANNIDLSAFGGTNYLLDTANKGVRAKYQGGRLMVISRW